MAKKADTNRKPGRPKTLERPIGPAEQDRIASLYLRHYPLTAIAEELGVSEHTVRHHLQKHVRPAWREQMAADLGADLAKTREIERAAWERHRETSDPADLAMAKWAVEHRAKVFGHYAAAKMSVQQGPAIRVCGQSPDQFDQETLTLLLERIQERRAYQQSLRNSLN
jgi:AraC-like DNA-binding protein